MNGPVLVTGGAGFLGAALVAALVARGEPVVVLDNFATGRRESLAHFGPDQVRVVEGDVRDERLLRRVLAGAGTVFHLACLGVRRSLRVPLEVHEVNATGTLLLTEAAREAGVPRFVHVSSSEVYGPARSGPMTEDHPCAPTTAYGASKLAGEAYARAAHLTWGLPAVIVRPFNAFGPGCHHEGESGEVIPRFLLAALAGRAVPIFGDGRQTRDFTYVDDTMRGLLQAAEQPAAVGGTFNLGSGQERAIRDLPAAIARAAGVPTPLMAFEPARPGDVRRLIADSNRARQVLGYVPSVSFDDGLRRLVEWYRDGLLAEAVESHSQ